MSGSRPWEAFGPTWVTVDLDVLAANFTEIAAFVRRARPERARDFITRHGLRAPADPVKILVVVKADAYGHGAPEAARAAVEAGADMLGVSTLAEALELRQAGLAGPILMIDPLTPAEAAVAVQAGVTPTVTSLEAARAFSAEACRLGNGERRKLGAGEARKLGFAGGLPVHVSVDTGMSRYGVAPDDLPGFAAEVAALPGLTLEGLYTHFSAGSERTGASLEVMRRQLERFARAVAAVEARGIQVPLRHAACSAAVLRLPESYLDMVRVGNLFYGFGGPAVVEDGVQPPRVREAWSLSTQVLEVREVPAGTGVGYGPDVTVHRTTRLGTVPVGYADGVGLDIKATSFRWRLRLRLALQAIARWFYRHGLLFGPLARLGKRVENIAVFSHNGRPLEIVGRISMRETILNLTAHPEIGPGSAVAVRLPRVLASPRLARVYFSAGRVVTARTASGLAEAAAGGEV